MFVTMIASCTSGENTKTRLVKETFKEVKGFKYHTWQYQRYNNGIKYDSLIYHVENDKKVFVHSVTILEDGIQM